MKRLVLFTSTRLAPQDIQELTVQENHILYQLLLADNTSQISSHVLGKRK
jgi:hypothetical protein